MLAVLLSVAVVPFRLPKNVDAVILPAVVMLAPANVVLTTSSSVRTRSVCPLRNLNAHSLLPKPAPLSLRSSDRVKLPLRPATVLIPLVTVNLLPVLLVALS